MTLSWDIVFVMYISSSVHPPIDHKVHDLAMIITCITMSFDSLINVDNKFHIDLVSHDNLSI